MKREIKLILVFFSFVICMLMIPTIHAQPSSVNVEFNGNFINGTVLYSDVYIIDGYIYGKDVYPNRSSIQKINVCKNRTISTIQKICYNKTIYRIINGNSTSIIIKSCSRQKVNQNVTVCRNITDSIGCMNPSGKYTNQLALSNFKYSLNNSTWQEIPYHEIGINSSSVYFKLEIPSLCSPKYYINKAIFIK